MSQHCLCSLESCWEKEAAVLFLPRQYLTLNYSQVKLLPTDGVIEEEVMYAMRSEAPEEKCCILYSSTQNYIHFFLPNPEKVALLC